MKINTDKNCNIVIIDDTEYPINGLDYSNSASLYIAQLNESDKSTILYNKLDSHTNSTGEPIILTPQKGGFITMCHIILPKVNSVDEYNPLEYTEKYVKTKDYIKNKQIDNILGITSDNDESIDNTTETSNNISGGYFTDGTSLYYKDVRGNVKTVEISEIIEVNSEVFGITKYIQNFFSVCYLRRCYISLCQKIFNDRGFDRCFNGKVDPQLTYKRDLVWAALNVIQYMIDSNQLAEAQRLLERINGCNGLCSSEYTGEKGCGCE